jgi:hypothetical protein
MRTLSRRGLVLAGGVGAMALAYGLTRLPLPSESEERSPGPLDAGARAEAPSENVAGPATSARRGQVSATAPALFEDVSEEPPMELGEPLNADSSQTEESRAFGRDSVDIGPELDADEPLGYELGSQSAPPRNLGEPLDASGPDALCVVGKESVSIGPDLDADDAQGSDFYHPVPVTVDIGEIKDAGEPMTR